MRGDAGVLEFATCGTNCSILGQKRGCCLSLQMLPMEWGRALKSFLLALSLQKKIIGFCLHYLGNNVDGLPRSAWDEKPQME